MKDIIDIRLGEPTIWQESAHVANPVSEDHIINKEAVCREMMVKLVGWMPFDILQNIFDVHQEESGNTTSFIVKFEKR